MSDELTKSWGQKIVNIGIYLTIYQKDSVNLTLIDLPGIYYGDKIMTNMIKGMYKEHIKNPESIILYTTTCTADLNTGEAYSLAKDADPNGERTLIVGTKIDRREKVFMN